MFDTEVWTAACLARPGQVTRRARGSAHQPRPALHQSRSRRESGGPERFVQGAFERDRTSAGLDDVVRARAPIETEPALQPG